MKELARRITNRIRLDMLNKRILTIGKVMTFNGLGELNKFVNIKVITKQEAEIIWPMRSAFTGGYPI